MKHDIKITLIIVLLFLAAQFIGLAIVDHYIVSELPFGIEKPVISEDFSYISIAISLIFVTFLALLLVKFKAIKVWKAWFFIASLYLLTIAFSAFFDQKIALVGAIAFTSLRFFRPSIISHNIVELFVYAGIAAIFVPILSVFAIIILLIIISIYDMIAVWKTKHMIKLANFQAKAKTFAGLAIPYARKTITNKKTKEKQKVFTKTAILGGGDVGFPMLFAGVLLKTSGFLDASLIAVFSAIALFVLLLMSKKNKFYPAMPFISAGCFLGYFIGLFI
jgi:presenilin-like A22 family membrane protease